MSVMLACFLGISQNAGTLPELNVYIIAKTGASQIKTVSHKRQEK